MASVVRDWLENITLKQQTVVLTAIRGCDQVAKYDVSKKIIRKLRNTVLHDACPNSEYMKIDVSEEDIHAFLKQPDTYAVHWLLHFLHAIEIIGYKHPDTKTRKWWASLYLRMCDMLHVNPETEEQNDERLRDNIEANCWKT